MMTTPNPSPWLTVPGLLLGLAVFMLAGCQSDSSDVSANRPLSDHGNTFALELPLGRVDSFPDDAAIDDNARETVRKELESRGFYLMESGSANLLVDLIWVKSLNPEPSLEKTIQETTVPESIGQKPVEPKRDQISLTVVVKDPASGATLWKSDAITPVDLQTFSWSDAQMMVRVALSKFPVSAAIANYKKTPPVSVTWNPF